MNGKRVRSDSFEEDILAEKKNCLDHSDGEHEDHDQEVDEDELDVEDEDMDDDEVKQQNTLPKDRVSIMEFESRVSSFESLHGSVEELLEFDARFGDFNKEMWGTLADGLLRCNVDVSCSDQDLLVAFKMFYQLFCYKYENDYSVVDRVHLIYPDVTTMKDQYNRITNTYGIIHLELLNRRLANDNTSYGREINRMLTCIAFSMKYTYEQMVINRLLQHGADKSLRAMLEQLNPLSFFQEIDTSKLKKHQQLLHYYYREAFKNHYRKEDDSILKMRYNKNGEFVYAYEYVMDICDFVFQNIFPIEQNHYWFQCLTERGNCAAMCTTILTNVKSEWLPQLERNRNVHSFQNGLFIISLNKFFYLKKIPGKAWVGDLTGNIVAIKYHDQQFDEVAMCTEMEQYSVSTYMAIRMDSVHQIFSTQEFNMNERRWILGFLGRLLHQLGAFDHWTIHLWFLGIGGTGKSSLLRLLASLLEARDVGYLNNTLQKTFALEGIYETLMYLALDIDQNFGLDQATFQSMVVGEEVSVIRKYKRPLTVAWGCPGAFASNNLPKWTDNGGQITRRLVIVEFLRTVHNGDPNLFEKCLKQKDRFLKVITASYFDLVETYSDCNIKEAMPKKFKDSEKKALMQLNALISFISDTCILLENEDQDEKEFTVSFRDFSTAYKIYCKKNGINDKPLTYSSYSGVFSKYQIIIVDPKGDNDEYGYKVKYITSVKLNPGALDED
jgi:hypothetical protein